MKTFTFSILSLASILSGVTAVPAESLEARQLATATTQNGLTGSCKPVTVIFARGTTEAGNVGSLTGPPFFQAMATAMGGANNLAIQGVDYPADIPGFLAGGDANGSKKMASLVQQAATQCPDTKIVMSGYSQGGQLVHNAAASMSANMSAKVNSVVIFGDPDNGKAVGKMASSKVMVICHTGDNICQGGDAILTPHLTYSTNAQQAAAFVKGQTGM